MQTKSRFQRSMLFGVVLSLLLLAGTSVARAQEKSLYERIGGYNALAAVVDDFVGRLVADKQFERFFAGHSTDSIKKLRQHVVEFLCFGTGGPCVYVGRDMKTTHAGLNITEKDWDVSVQDLIATLDKFKVPAKEKDEVLAAVGALKKDIVEKP